MTSRGTTPWFAPTYTKNVSFTGPSAPAGLPPDVGPPTGDPPPHAARNDSAAVVEIPSAADRCRNCRRLIPRRYRRSSVLISSGTGPPPSPSAVAEAPVVAFAGPPAVPERASSYRDEYDAEARVPSVQMHFTIVGAGAIGGITGAHLIRAGHDVTFVESAEDHLAALRRDGLILEGLSRFTVRPAAALRPDELRPPLGAVICAVKTLHTRAALEPVARLLAPDEYVLSMQNGLAYYDVIDAVGRERTLVGCFNFGGHYEAPGRVVHGTRGGFHVGELDGRITPRLRALRDALAAVQECEASENVLGCLWSKIAMASIFFATALVDADVKDILSRERYRGLIVDLVAESVAAADAMGVRLIELHGFDPEAFRPEDRKSVV